MTPTSERRQNDHPRLTWLGLSAIAALVLPLLPTPRLDQIPVAWSLLNAVHVPLGAGLTVLLATLLRRRVFRPEVSGAILAAILLATVELAQWLLATGTPSLRDLAYDGVGILAAMLWFGLRDRAGSWRLVAGSAIIAVAAIAWPGTDALTVWRQEKARQARFPLLASFDQTGCLLPWRGSGGLALKRVPSPGRPGLSLRCEFVRGERPAALFTYPPEDWSGYTHLEFVARSIRPDSLRVTLKITDRELWSEWEHRYTREFVFGTDERTFRLGLADLVTPSGRRIDVEHVNTVVYFVRHPDAPGAFEIDEIRLTGTDGQDQPNEEEKRQ